MSLNNVGVTWIASKIATCCYNISYGYGSISIRDQVVRAQLLIADLNNIYSQCDVGRNLLIVGAGFAGTTAAVVAAKCGFNVVLIDSQSNSLSLQRGVHHRYVGAFMYDWPCAESALQHYPPKVIFGDIDESKIPTPEWESLGPVTAAVLAEKHSEWFDANKPSKGLTEYYSIDHKSTEKYVREFIAWKKISSKKKPEYIGDKLGKLHKIGADIVILACGMGEEKVQIECLAGMHIKGKKFWGVDDDFRKNKKLKGNSLVVGGGDGALQDVLRLITRHDDILSIVKSMECDTVIGDAIDKIKPLLLSIQLQTTLGDSHKILNVHKNSYCRVIEVAENVFRDNRAGFLEWGKRNIRECFNDGFFTVHHIIKSDSFGKSFVLNKFAVHIIGMISRYAGLVRYELHKNIKTEADLVVTSKSGKKGIIQGGDVASVDIKSRAFINNIEFISIQVGFFEDEEDFNGIRNVIKGEYSAASEFNPIKALGNVYLPKVLYDIGH